MKVSLSAALRATLDIAMRDYEGLSDDEDEETPQT
jgi:hypothetical protein